MSARAVTAEGSDIVGITAAVAVGAAFATIAAIVWGTRPFGPGLYGDGAGYLSAAESLVRFGHLRVVGAPYSSADSLMPMRQWPPGFSVAVAAPLRAGLSLMAAVRLVQMVAGAVTAALTVVLVARTLTSVWGAVAALAVLVTPAILGTELNVVSEPLYIAFLAVLLCAMTFRPQRALLSGVVAAAMVMVRYLGIAAIAAIALWAVAQPSTLATKARRGLAALLPGSLVYGAWALAVRHSGGAMTTSVVDLRLGTIVRAFVGSIGAWLAPWLDGPTWLHVAAKTWIVVFAVCAVLVALNLHTPAIVPERKGSSDISSDAVRGRLIHAASLLAICHLGVLLIARVLTSSVDFSSRTFAPVYYLFTVLAVVALGIAWRGSARMRALAFAAAVAWFAGGAVATGQSLNESRAVGLDHARIEERSSPTIAWLRMHASGTPLYTNEPAKIFFHLHRDARALPWVATDDTLRRVNEALDKRPGYVVWFAGGRPALYVPAPLMAEAISLEKLQANTRLTTVAWLDDGVVMAADAPASTPAACCVLPTTASHP